MNKPKPIARRPGGKTRLLKRIMPKIPAHEIYCEPFFGGGAVLFAKDRARQEVVNDMDGNLVALYRNVQFHLPALLGELEFLFASRDNLHDFIAQPGITDLQRAARFLLVNRTSFGANMHSFGVSKSKGGGVGFRHAKISDLLGQAKQRLDGVIVENIPYERCLKNYDSPATFFFLDPPYLNAQVDAYKGWMESQMRGFRREVEKLKGKWMVTVDDSPLNRELFSDCRIEAVETQNGITNRRTHNQKFGELIITP